MIGPSTEVTPRGGVSGVRASVEEPEQEPAAPVVPNGLLQLMTGENAGTLAPLWEWQRMPLAGAATAADARTATTVGRPAPVASSRTTAEAGSETTARDAAEETDGSTSAKEGEDGAPAGATRAGQTVVVATPDAGVRPPRPQTAEEPMPQSAAILASETESASEVDLREGSGLQAWGDTVRAATARRIRAPAPSDPSPTIDGMTERAARVGRREVSRRERAFSDVRGVLPPALDLPIPQPPPKIPKPEVEARVTAAGGKQLPEQVLPVVTEYTHVPAKGPPQVFRPQIAAIQLAAGSRTTLTPIEPPKPTAREARRRVRAAKQASQQLAPVPAKGAFTLGTVPAAGQAGVPPAPRVAMVDIAGVLARLRLGIPSDARAMLEEIRRGMYPRSVLHRQLPNFGAEQLPDLEARMSSAIEEIATEAGIDLAVVRNATRDASAKVVLGKDTTKARLTTAEKDARATLEDEGQASRDTDAGIAAGVAVTAEETLRSVRAGASPAEIRAQRDGLVARVHRRLAPEDLRYEREGEDRQRALQLMAGVYEGAYLDVARRVQKRIEREAGATGPTFVPAPTPVLGAPTSVLHATSTTAAAVLPPPFAPPPLLASTPDPLAPRDSIPAAILASPADVWSVERLREIRRVFTQLRKDASNATAAFRAEIVATQEFAVRVLGEWVESEVEEQEHFWERLLHAAEFRRKDALDRTQAWQEARSARLDADLRGDIAFVSGLASEARSEAEIKAVGGLGGLSDAQRAIIAAYFTGNPPHDPLGAVAAGMRVRITQVHRPRITDALNQQLYALPKDRWHDVAVVAESEEGNIKIEERGDRLYASVNQWGTDEAMLYAALSDLTSLQRHAVDLYYQHKTGHTIEWELKDELGDAELDRAKAIMAGDRLAADAAAIRDAIEGAGTDEQEIYRVLRNKKPEERARLEEIYLTKYGTSLQEDLDDDMDGGELERAKALMAGDQSKADAIGLEIAKSGKWHGGPDTEAIQAIYAQNRLEVEQEAQEKGWTSQQLRQQNVKRIDEIDRVHRAHYREGEEQGRGLAESFKATLTGPELELALGLHDLDLARADAARLELEKRSFITDDKVVTKILESQYDRAETEARLDAEHRLAYRMDLAAVRGEKWDDERERAVMRAEVTAEAGRRAEGYMTTLKDKYNSRYATDLMSLQYGPGGFDQLIESGLQGSDKDRAKALVAKNGRLNPAEEIKYAVQGAGTDVDVLRRMLEGKNKAEIKAIEDQWDELYPDGPKLRDRIMDDVSGRDAVDLSEMLEAPETPREKLESALRRQKFERETFSLGSMFGEEERQALDAQVERLRRMVDEYEDLAGAQHADPDRLAFLKWRTNQEMRGVDAAIEEHRRNADSVTDKLTMAAAVLAGAIVTGVTWGAAGPFVAGALGALAATEATIITKIAVKGAAYSEEELLVDVISGAVDVVMALATAGIGNAMLRVTKGIPVGRLAQLATSASRAKRMVAHGVANGVEGLIGGIPSGAAGALADEKTWSQGNVLPTVLTGTAMGAASGAVMGGLIGSTGGWRAAPVPLNLPPGSMPDAAGRAAQWQVHRQQHPTASYKEFAADFDAGRIRPDPVAAAKFQRASQEALGAGLPRADRKLLNGIAVTVLTDAEFSRVTRSSKAQAVTIVENGRPRVVMRESAALTALREEGIHVAQALDPQLAGYFRVLDEAVVSGWDQLPLGTKLAVYAAKLELEVDANARMLGGLKQEADGLPPGDARNALLNRAAEVRDTLDTLLARQRELASFGVFDRLAARLRAGTLATRLDQPARLFSKSRTKRRAGAGAPPAPPGSTAGKGHARRPGARSGPDAPLAVDEQRRVVSELRARIAGLEAREVRRGRLTKAQSDELATQRGRLEEHYAVAPPEARRTQEAQLFDRRPGESLVDYETRLRALRGEVEAKAVALDNVDLWERYEILVRRTEAGAVKARQLRSDLASVDEQLRVKAIEWNKNVRAHRLAPPGQPNDFYVERLAIEREFAALRADRARIRGRIAAHEHPPSLFFGDQPWRSELWLDPTNPLSRGRIGLVGELDTCNSFLDAGFEPLGATVDSRHVTTKEALDAIMRTRHGRQDIDGIFRRSRTDATEYVLADSKATADIVAGAPQGTARLKRMASDRDTWQLSNDWLLGHLKDAPIGARDLRNLTEALKHAGKKVTVTHPDGSADVVMVRKVYAHTSSSGPGAIRTRLYDVAGDPPTIGGEYRP